MDADKFVAAKTRFDDLFEGRAAKDMRLPEKAVKAAIFITLYRDQPVLHVPFKILSDLMAIDELLSLWRYRHALMAQRMLGGKSGSGGSSGHDYLAETVSKHRIFSDLFAISTYLIPRSQLPKLPRDVQHQMGFRYWGDNV